MGSEQFGLSPELFVEAFPFHLVIDRRLYIVQAGQSICRIAPSLRVGQPLLNAFRIQRPMIDVDFKTICEHRDKIFLLAARDVDELFFKGQMMLDPQHGQLVFVGSPWLHANTELRTLGLKLNDFALHDPAVDFLFLFKSNRAALDDTNELAAKLREEKEWAHVTLGSIGDGVIATSIDGQVSYMNRVAEQMTGHDQTQAIGQPLEQVLNLVDEISRHSYGELLKSAMSKRLPSSLPSPALLLNSSGSDEYIVEGVLTPIQDSQKQTIGMVVVFHDISDRQHLIQQLEHQATHDYLTSLPNRLLLCDRIEQAIGQACRHIKQAALLFLDLDRFKTINDSLGHQVGDQLLKLVAERLSGVVRKTDTVCRIGGDEFVLLISEIEREEFASQVAEKVLSVLKAPFHISNYSLSISASIGISLYPEDASGPDLLLKHADLAMYHAKSSGRNNFQFFSAKMDRKAIRRLSIESSLRKALERDEFSLYYQPKLVIGSGRVAGSEALIRWHNQEHGDVPPDRFIPIAEETGLIIPISEWVIEEASRQMAAWRDAGLMTRPVAVNISLIQLAQIDLEQTLVAALHRYGNTPDMLELEFTESVLLQDFETAMAVLERLRRLGFTLTIDDFGVGYSSLNYLNRFPIDVLKIDRSFIGGVCEDADSAAIVQAVVGLSHNLKIRVVAEGCETLDQFAYLQRIGCDQVQGYLVSRPLPALDMPPFFHPDFLFEQSLELFQ